MRISSGLTVSVSANTERWLSDVRAGRGFGGNTASTGAAGQFGHVQLFNPVGSGVSILVRLVILSVTAAQAVAVALYNTALTTLEANGINLLSGGTAGLGELRRLSNAAQLGTILSTFDVLASTPLPIGIEWLSELGEGEGVLVFCGTVATTIRASFFWLEA